MASTETTTIESVQELPMLPEVTTSPAEFVDPFFQNTQALFLIVVGILAFIVLLLLICCRKRFCTWFYYFSSGDMIREKQWYKKLMKSSFFPSSFLYLSSTPLSSPASSTLDVEKGLGDNEKLVGPAAVVVDDAGELNIKLKCEINDVSLGKD